MPDPRRDPHDETYLRAEARLEDDAARAARRRRVLAAVERDASLRPAPLPMRRRPWRYGGLAAVILLGVSAGMAYRLWPVASPPRPASTTTPPPPQPSAAGTAPPAAAPVTPSPPPAPAPLRRSEPTAKDVRLPSTAIETPPINPAQEAPPPALPLPPQAKSAAEPAPPPSAVPAASLPSPASRASATRTESFDGISAPDRRRAEGPAAELSGGEGAAARLRAAAAAGRTTEVETLLDQGAPVDAADASGDTALIESVRAGHPETAALLRRRGADPARRNKAGVSASDTAKAVDDPRLTEAIAPPR